MKIAIIAIIALLTASAANAGMFDWPQKLEHERIRIMLSGRLTAAEATACTAKAGLEAIRIAPGFPADVSDSLLIQQLRLACAGLPEWWWSDK
jgi:hypothetical protein